MLGIFRLGMLILLYALFLPFSLFIRFIHVLCHLMLYTISFLIYNTIYLF
jgi:hypothetical protein